jgi:predicted MFS family arabinose efflux permease
LVLFGLTFFATNAGPNSTTFVAPQLMFPGRVRATAHGLSAAAGKAGAVLGALSFDPMTKSYGLRTALVLCALVALLGCLSSWTYICPRDRKDDFFPESSDVVVLSCVTVEAASLERRDSSEMV